MLFFTCYLNGKETTTMILPALWFTHSTSANANAYYTPNLEF